jgi:hypothetical protein
MFFLVFYHKTDAQYLKIFPKMQASTKKVMFFKAHIYEKTQNICNDFNDK